MDRAEVSRRLNGFAARRDQILSDMVPAARAAAHTLKDMKMDRTAEPLLELLFKMDGLAEELAEFCRSNTDAVMDALTRKP